MNQPIVRETNKKDSAKAWLWTLLMHLGLIASLFFLALRTPLPLPEEQGVEVALGYDQQGMGLAQPMASMPVSPANAQPPASAREEVATQNNEESIALPDSKKATKKPKTETKPTETKPKSNTNPEPAKKAVVVEKPQPQVDQKALFPGKDQRSGSQKSQGDGQVPGYQGNPNGTPGATNFQGEGGSGSGISFSLTGRKANYLPKPSYDTQAQGKVVVKIYVNQKGEVTRAIAGVQGSTTTDQHLVKLAYDAAMRARFDLKNDAAEEQVGTITYVFIRQN